jgi:polynucleotide 5'-kinase involved in rRNA processing
MVCTLTLGEESRLRVFENRVLMRKFEPKRDEVVGEWRKLRNEKLNDFYSSPNIRVVKFRRMRRGREVLAHVGERRG